MAGTEFFVVPVEHLRTIESMTYPEGGAVRRLYTSIEGRVLFRLDVKNSANIPYYQKDRMDLGIAFNSVTRLNTHLLYHLQARFDHTGKTDTTKYVQPSNELEELWNRNLPVVVVHVIERSACVRAFAARDEWEHQLAWGKVHQVMRLIGAA